MMAVVQPPGSQQPLDIVVKVYLSGIGQVTRQLIEVQVGQVETR